MATKLGPTRLKALREALVAKRRQLETEVGRSALYEKGVDEDATKDLGDQANTAYTREFQFELGNGDRRLLREVEIALRKLDEGTCAALVLASAGMRRLGFGARITTAMPIESCVPAPGQGIVAIEIRADDEATREAVQRIHDPAAGLCLEAERALVAALGGGCQLPLGGVTTHVDGQLEMHGVVVSPDGSRAVRARQSGPAADPAALGRRVADALARQGAAEILDAVRRAQGPVEGSY